MGSVYGHFTAEERDEIARRRALGETTRQIAAALHRAPSSLSRELKRNANASGAYRPSLAHELAGGRRWHGARLERDSDLQTRVLERLGWGWSPQQVSGRLARESGHAVISHESIYRFIAAQIARTKDYAWRLYLPRAKSKRGRRGRRGGSPADHIKGRISIDKRPQEAADRGNPGHWEADLMLFASYGQVVLALHERSSRFTLVTPQPGKHADPLAETLGRLLGPLPDHLRKTITFDNGTEFAGHQRLRDRLKLQTFFCDPHAPWQKGGVENAIGRFRRYLPRKTDIHAIDPQTFFDCAARYNHTPRKCLDFRTPAEVFSTLLHFNCETTFPPSRE